MKLSVHTGFYNLKGTTNVLQFKSALFLLEGDYFNKVLLRMLKDFINKYKKFIISLQLKESLNIASAALYNGELWPAFSFKYSANTRLSGA